MTAAHQCGYSSCCMKYARGHASAVRTTSDQRDQRSDSQNICNTISQIELQQLPADEFLQNRNNNQCRVYWIDQLSLGSLGRDLKCSLRVATSNAGGTYIIDYEEFHPGAYGTYFLLCYL